jgi:hypothetical protein
MMHRGVLRIGWGRLTVATITCVVAAPAIVAADAHAHRTAQGVAVETPAIASLDCPAMRRVLDAIDSSGYRGLRPEPLDAADRALLDYEHRLSAQYYATCVSALTRSLQSSTAFTHGFTDEATD